MAAIATDRPNLKPGNESLLATAEQLLIPIGALIASALVFSIFLIILGKDPLDFFSLVWRGGFATSFSLQNTLQRSAPLILTGLACAVPVQVGLLVIGAEGALVLGAFAAAAIAVPMIHAGIAPFVTMPVMMLSAIVAGAVWVGLAGWLRHARGVNETISSLLLTYIAIAIMNFFVEGLLRDPGSANKPSTMPIGKGYMVGAMPGTDVHWGLFLGVALAIILQVLMSRTTFGFAARVTGGNTRAARAQGLPVGKLILACSGISGACAGLAGYFEVAAIHGQANASLVAGYGYTGILVSFLARHKPLAIVPVAILFGSIQASGGVIQRRMDMPDATILVLQGIIFVVVLASETLQGRFAIFRPRAVVDRT